MLIDARIISNKRLQGDYFTIEFEAPELKTVTQPGQFVHLRLETLRDRILRRPFSIYNVDDSGVLTLIYKVVGQGTEILSDAKPGEHCNLMGPLGKGFSIPEENRIPVIIAGGYGAAATYLLAKKSPKPGILLLGARSADDILITEKYAELGFETRLATEDGSLGTKGLVTNLLDSLLVEKNADEMSFFACGPTGMLLAVGKQLQKDGIEAELSLDHRMACGIGACFACVMKLKDESPEGWRYVRTCKEGPVFKASEVYDV